MNSIQVLDCTLRDGGYCNQWRFGFNNSCKIVQGLVEANLDIIECGFLTEKQSYDVETTKFTTFSDVSKIIPQNRNGKTFVAMMNYGEYSIESVPEWDGSSIDGIRVAFHKKDRIDALEFCQELKNKGYKVFIQAMVSLSYSDEEFLDLIKRVNAFEPFSFYIVDSFGMMKGKDLVRLFYMVEHNLKGSIIIGFHSHNNLQLAYSNAQQLLNVQSSRNLIIDSSIYGMGRGAGNLTTELFLDYLNDFYNGNYQIKPLLRIIDEILNDFLQKGPWGYSLPNYLSAVHYTHPNYAGYLADKNTLTVEAMNDIFDMMDDEKRVSFDKEYIEKLYVKYMATGKVQQEHEEELKEKLKGATVVVIAPGKSSMVYSEKISDYLSSSKAVSISVNHEYKGAKTDYIFVSNLRRYREIDSSVHSKCIVTSNIPGDGVYLQTKYYDLLNDIDAVKDNAGLMVLKFLIKQDVESIMLAGYDGYSHDTKENYSDSQLEIITKNAILDAMNDGMKTVLSQFNEKVKIAFLTEPKNLFL